MFYREPDAGNPLNNITHLITLNVFFVIGFLLSGTVVAQTNKPTIKEKTFTLSIHANTQSEALVVLGHTVGYNFSYNTDIVNDEPVKIKFRNETLSVILSEILGEQFNGYEIIGKQIVILPEKTANRSGQRKIYGALYGADNKEPIGFANIGVNNKGYGTVSNSDGEFELVIDSVNQNDTLVISALGYVKQRIPIQKIKTGRQILFLENKYIPIQEVIIRQSDPKKIVYNAIQRIGQNYFTSALRLKSFYREYLLKNNILRNLYEASVEIYKPSYSSFFNDQIRVEKALQIIDSTKRDSVTVKLKGGLTNISSLDMAKSLPLYFNTETLHAYKYSLQDIVYMNGQEVYVIHFRPRKNYDVPPYQGRLYIEKEQMALIKAEVETKPGHSREDIGIRVFKKTARLKIQVKTHVFHVQYSEINNRYFMNYFRSQIYMRVKSDNSLFFSNYHLISEMVVNQIDTSDVSSFPFRERINPQIIFSERIKDYPNKFWNNYNTLPPEKEILHEYFTN
jgi:hypothetical protein